MMLVMDVAAAAAAACNAGSGQFTGSTRTTNRHIEAVRRGFVVVLMMLLVLRMGQIVFARRVFQVRMLLVLMLLLLVTAKTVLTVLLRLLLLLLMLPTLTLHRCKMMHNGIGGGRIVVVAGICGRLQLTRDLLEGVAQVEVLGAIAHVKHPRQPTVADEFVVCTRSDDAAIGRRQRTIIGRGKCVIHKCTNQHGKRKHIPEITSTCIVLLIRFSIIGRTALKGNVSK